MTETQPARQWLKQAVSDGFAAARQYRWPGVALWVFGCCIIVAYYNIPSVHQFLEKIAALKTQWGVLFSAISTGLFGGLIPSLVDRFASQSSRQKPWLVSNTIFWAIKGVEIDLLYRFQAWLFGEGNDVATVAIKTFFDQFAYVPAFGLVNVILFFVWRDCGYRFSTFRRRLGKNWYRARVLPVMISNWIIWIPAVVLIYCFPLALQLPVQNLILCFWILLLTVLTDIPQEI